MALSEITAEAIENYLADRLQSGRRIHTKLGIQLGEESSPLPPIRNSGFCRIS